MSDDSLPVSDVLPDTGRILGIDFGTVRIGIAVCDPQQSIGSPLETRNVSTPEKDGEYFCGLAKTESAVGFVVGLPVHMSGDASQKSREAVTFGKWLRETTGLPVAWIDERYSTAMAKEICRQMGLKGDKRKKYLDRIAAQVILSAWIEQGDRVDPPPSLDR